jgi:hypothetical protein
MVFMLAVALDLVAVTASPSPTIIDPTDGNHTECAMRRLGYEKGLQLQPHRAPLIELFDALELNSLCGDPRPTRATRMYERVRSPAVDAFHVCASESTQLNGCHSDEVPCRSGGCASFRHIEPAARGLLRDKLRRITHRRT